MDTRNVAAAAAATSLIVSLSDKRRSALGSAFLFLERADSSSPAPKPEVPCPGYGRRERGQCVRVRPRGCRACARGSRCRKCAYATCDGIESVDDDRTPTTTRPPPTLRPHQPWQAVDAIFLRDWSRTVRRFRSSNSWPRASRSSAIDLSSGDRTDRNVGSLLSYGTIVRGVATRREASPEAEIARLRSPSRRGIGSTNVSSSFFLSPSLIDFDCHWRT